MLQIQNLTKKYGKNLAANQISLQVPDGKIGILLGPNGAGKSTVIKSIAGLLRYEGAIWIQGMPSREIAAKKIFAYVPEMPAMYEALTVIEHMEFIKRAYGVECSQEEVDELLKRFELDDKKDKLGNELSKGMMQKVSLCCALLIKPKVILLDEPMVGLDPAAIKELKKVLVELKESGATVLVSTHMLDMVKEFWDIMYVLDKGNVIGSFDREQVGDNMEDLFFELTSQKEEALQADA